MVFFKSTNKNIDDNLAFKATNKANSIVKYLLPEMRDKRKQYPANVPYTDHIIHMGEDDILTIRIYRPEQKNPFHLPPTIFHVPATAFILDIEKQGYYFHEVTGSLLAQLSDCNVVILKHRVSPKKTPLDQVKDCYYLFNKICENNVELHINVDDIGMTGYCTGATFANAITRLNILHGEKKIQYQILVSILADLTCTDKGYGDIEKLDCSTSKDFIQKVIKYSGVKTKDKKHPLISPFWQDWSKVKKNNFPQTDVIVGKNDVLFGDSKMLHEQLKKYGFKTTFLPINNGNHGSFWFSDIVIKKMALLIKHKFSINSISKVLKDETKIDPRKLSLVPLKENKDEEKDNEWNVSKKFRVSV